LIWKQDDGTQERQCRCRAEHEGLQQARRWARGSPMIVQRAASKPERNLDRAGLSSRPRHTSPQICSELWR
jgi:hypothetical protein